MNESAKAELQRILDLGPDSVNEDERAFLSARRDYLTEEQCNVFGLAEATEPSVANTEDSAEAPKPRQKK